MQASFFINLYIRHRLHTTRRALCQPAAEEGQALVEFALVLPVLLLVLFGITEFGLALNTANDETHLANEVARYATVNQNPANGGQSLAAWAKSQADSNFLASGGSVCISFPNDTSNIGDPVKVSVSAKVNWMPILKLGVTSTTVSGSAVMRLEATPSIYSAGCA
jgi:Flp pilus assembly protein TadG